MANLSKLSYIPAQYRVRYELGAQEIAANETIPQSIIDRATVRLEKEVEAGNIKDFLLDEEELSSLWEKLRKSILKPKEKISITVGIGIPDLKGVIVAKGQGLFACRVSIDLSKEKKKDISFRMIVNYVTFSLVKQGIKNSFSLSELHQLWIKAKNGKKVLNIPIHKAHVQRKEHRKGYLVRPALSFDGIEVILFDVNTISRMDAIDNIISEVMKQYNNHPRKKGMVILKEHLVRRIRSAMRGPERFGLMMPLTILAASRPKGELPRFGLATLLPRIGLESRVNAATGRMGMGQSAKKLNRPLRNFKRKKIKTPPSRYMEAASAMDLHALDDSFSEESSAVIPSHLTDLSQPKSSDNIEEIASTLDADLASKVQTQEEIDKAVDAVNMTSTSVEVLTPVNHDNYPFIGQITSSENGLSAFLNVKDDRIYDAPDAKKATFWKSYFADHNIKFGMSDKIIKSLIGVINTGAPIENFEIAIGQAAQGCDTPYIFELWQEKVVFSTGKKTYFKRKLAKTICSKRSNNW